MPLTPSDVANKQFKVAFRGYSLDEVDAFLDEVESEIARLLRENSDLRTRTEGSPDKPAAGSAAAASPLPGGEHQEAALRTLLLAQRTADEAVAEARAEAEQIVSTARAEVEGSVTQAREQAEQTLTAAREEAEQTLTAARAEADATLTTARAEADQALAAARTSEEQAAEHAERTRSSADAEAEQTLSSARAEAEQTLTAARAEAEQTLASARAQAEQSVAEASERAERLVDEAQAEADAQLSRARAEAEATLTGARSESERLLTDAQERSARAQAQVDEQVSSTLGDLDSRRTRLERHIEDLRAFEREYRTRLRAYLESQLADLGVSGPPEDAGNGVPAEARAAAVGLGPLPGSAPEQPVLEEAPVEVTVGDDGVVEDAALDADGDAPAVPAVIETPDDASAHTPSYAAPVQGEPHDGAPAAHA